MTYLCTKFNHTYNVVLPFIIPFKFNHTCEINSVHFPQLLICWTNTHLQIALSFELLLFLAQIQIPCSYLTTACRAVSFYYKVGEAGEIQGRFYRIERHITDALCLLFYWWCDYCHEYFKTGVFGDSLMAKLGQDG